MGLEGYVKVRFIVDLEGNVESLEIIDATNSLFIPAVEDAYMKAKFNPGEKNGRRVKFKMAQKIPFTIS
jgi:TonB family protein